MKKLNFDMKKTPLVRVSLVTFSMLLLTVFSNITMEQPTNRSLSSCSLGINATTARAAEVTQRQYSLGDRLAWTVAQNNRNGSNGFSHLDYPNKAVVKNANSYEGITPSNTIFAYVVACQSNTLTIINATNAWAQTEFSSYPVTDPHDLYVMEYPRWGRVAFVCSFSQGALYAINVTNPNQITTLDVRNDSSNTAMYLDVDEERHILYLTDWNASRDDYLLAYNISDPSDISLLCKVVVPRGKPWSPRVNTNNRDYVYVACEGEGAYQHNGSVCIFNVTWVRNTTSPSMHYMKAQGKGSFADLQLDGSYLYGATPLNWSLCVWDVSTPMNLTTVSVTNLQTYNHFCLVASPTGHKYAFVRHYDTTVGDHGVTIADINDANNPGIIGYIPDDGRAHQRDLWRCHWMQCAYNNITNTWVLYVIGYMDNSWVTFNITFNATSKPPVADFSYTMKGLSVTFDGSSSYDPDGVLMCWQWSFGDSTDGAGVIISHTFPSVGSYTVSVVVTDSDGATSIRTATIKVEELAFQKALIFGEITNLSPEEGGYTFEAVRIGVFTVVPLRINTYTSGEVFTIREQYRGILRPSFIFAFCEQQLVNINLTGLFL